MATVEKTEFLCQGTTDALAFIEAQSTPFQLGRNAINNGCALTQQGQFSRSESAGTHQFALATINLGANRLGL